MPENHIKEDEVSKMWMYHVKGAIKRNWLNVLFDAPFVLSGPLLYYIEELTDVYKVSVGEYNTKQITTFTLAK